MIIQIKQRDRVKVLEIAIGETFKFVDNNTCFQRIDLSKEVAFKDILRNDIAYCVNIATGELTIFEASMVVEKTNLKVVEE